MIELKSMAVAMPKVVGHPNRRAFRGVLTMVDVASERAPSGARGHRVMLTKQAAEAALPSLLGMALDYSPLFDRHDARRKVGVITRAEIVGRNVELGGYLFARDFPEIVDEIAKCAGGNDGRRMASSYEGERGIGGRRQAGEKLGESKGFREGYGLRNSLTAAAERMFSLAAMMKRGSQARARNGGMGTSLRAETCVRAGGAAGLGLSYEVTGVEIADMRDQVWKLVKVTFTGAAILWRNKAAYQDTWIELGG